MPPSVGIRFRIAAAGPGTGVVTRRVLSTLALLAISTSSPARGAVDSTLTATDPLARHTRSGSGARAGLVVGGVVGAGLFLLGGAVAEGVCEYDCPDIQPLGYVGLGALGLGVGALAGALVGSLFGSMIPAESPGDPVPPASTPTAWAPETRSIASLSLEPGWAAVTARPEDDAGFLIRAALLAQLEPWLAVGPEVTYADLAGGLVAVEGATCLGRRGPGLRPYAVLSVGWQHWKTGIVDSDVSVLGAGVGGGLSWTPRSGGIHLGLEARYHGSLQNIEQRESYTFVDVSGVLRRSW